MSNPKTWAYVLAGPGRSAEKKQCATVGALGADLADMGTLWVDRIKVGKRGRNAGQSQLTERNLLLAAVRRGDRVIVAEPYAVGLSPDDAAWFAGQLAEKGVALVVNGGMFVIEPGDDPADLVAEVGAARNRAQVAASKARSRAGKT